MTLRKHFVPTLKQNARICIESHSQTRHLLSCNNHIYHSYDEGDKTSKLLATHCHSSGHLHQFPIMSITTIHQTSQIKRNCGVLLHHLCSVRLRITSSIYHLCYPDEALLKQEILVSSCKGHLHDIYSQHF